MPLNAYIRKGEKYQINKLPPEVGGRGGPEEVNRRQREKYIKVSIIKIFNKRKKLEKEQKDQQAEGRQ